MTEQNDFLRDIILLLEQAGIPYMISGSVASSFHGYPRATNDTDIIIDPTPDQLSALVNLLRSGFYVSTEAAMEALERRTMFNVISTHTGDKADFIIRKDRPYSSQEFARRSKANVSGMQVYVLSPEDSILSKLEWSKDRQSETQLNDALNVMLIQKDKLDFDYLKKWAAHLGVEDALERLMEAAQR